MKPHYSLWVLALCFLEVSPSDQYKRLQNQFVPHSQHQVSQRTRGYKPIHLQANPSSRNFVSPQYSFVPRLKTIPNRRHDRKLFKSHSNYKNRSPIIIKPKYHHHTIKKSVSQKVPHRETRKIQDLQKTKNILKNKSFTKKYKPDEEKKDKLKLLEKDDNIAIESKVVETVVKPPKVSRDPPKTAYSVKPVPKFIIKQAGPSQTFGWVGPGSYAPLNIPNIFKSIGLDTSWNPDENSVYPVKLTYPAPTEKPKKTVVTSKPTKPSVKHTTTTSAPKVKEAPIPVYKPSNNIYKQPVTSKPFTNYKTGELETLYYGTEKVQPYTTTTKKPVVTTTQTTTTTTTTAAPSTTRYTFVYNTYKPSTKPPQQYHPAPTFYPNPPQTYFNSAPTYKPVAISTASPYHYSSPVPSYASSPHYNPIVSSPAPPAYPSSTPPPAAYFSSPTYAPVAFSSPAPYSPAYSTPAPYSPAYSTPAPYASSPHYSPVTSPAPSYNSPSYQPSSAFSQPIKPFTAFNIPAAPKVAEAPIDKSDSGPSLKNTVDLRSGSSPPVVGIIETENKNNPADDGEVFYIFYENEDLAQDSIESGLSLQRFIQEDFGEGKDNLFSESISEEIININNDQQKFPNFGLIEEVGKPEVQQPLFYDVPIKIEETNPGDDVRTIYVPIENAINVPDNFEVINISPTDVDSPFAVGSNQAQEGDTILPAVRSADRQPKTSDAQLSAELGSSYYGTRLEPRPHYDIVL